MSYSSDIISKVKLSPWQTVKAYTVVRFKDPTLSRQTAQWWLQLYQAHAPAALYSQKQYFSVFVSNFLEIWNTSGPSAADGRGK
jgi:hypothetical protein